MDPRLMRVSDYEGNKYSIQISFGQTLVCIIAHSDMLSDSNVTNYRFIELQMFRCIFGKALQLRGNAMLLSFIYTYEIFGVYNLNELQPSNTNSITGY